MNLLIEDDDIAESEEMITVNLEIPGSPDNGIISNETQKIVIIIDNDGLLEFTCFQKN